MRERILRVKTPGFTHPTQVRFQDADAAGIIFFPRVLEYFHDAFVRFLDDQNLGLKRIIDERNWLAPIVHTEADYRRPLRFGDPIAVELVGHALQDMRLTLGFRIRKTRTEEIAAVGHNVHRFINPETFKPIDIPDAAIKVFSALPNLLEKA